MKFTKTLIAIATTALICGPASAQQYSGGNAKSKLSGNGCKAETERNLDVLFYFDLGTDGHNTGWWYADIFRFGEAVDGEGPLIISKPGRTSDDAPKRATMDLTEDNFYGLSDKMGDFAEDCRNFVDFDIYYTQITRFDAAWSKNGEMVDVKLDAKSMFENDKGRMKNLSYRFRTGKMEIDPFI